MNKEYDIIDRIADFNVALNNIELEFPQYFRIQTAKIGDYDKIRNHFDFKLDNETKQVISVIHNRDYPDLIKRCLDEFNFYFPHHD